MTRTERCRVVVKCRPTFQHETEGLGEAAGGILIPGPGRVVLGKEFDADRVYLPSEGDAVYEDEVQALVASLYEGINATVFAYGASGSGKTHTVLGSKQSPGLVDRIADEVFARYDQRTCTVSVSVEELYCERFTDLLAASAQPPAPSGISSTSSGSGQHTVRSVLGRARPPTPRSAALPARYSWQKVTLGSSSEIKALIQKVLRKRHTASTCLNDKSSRSHVIVTITLEQRKAISEHKYAEDEEPPASSASSVINACAGSSVTGSSGIGSSLADVVGAGSSADLRQQDCSETRSVQEDASSEAGSSCGLDTYLIGKLYLVDLAGSENIKRSGADGARQKEAGDINKSLCHLKTVIEEIFKGRRVSTYRNSKLTFRLQDALGGGNSKLLVVACISTAKQDLAETKETLRFAEMARAITNTPVVNREPKDELIHRLQEQLAELQDQIKTARQEGGRAAVEEVLQQLAVLEAAHADLQEELEAKEAQWATAAGESQLQASSLHSQLAHVRQQLASEQAAAQALTQQLVAQRAVLHGSQQAGAAAAALLLDVQADVGALQQQCSALQQHVSNQQEAATHAHKLCSQQQQQAQLLQGQLSAQASELELLRQQLQQERSARAAAESRASQLQQERDAARQSAQRLAADACKGTQQLSLLCKTLQQQVAAAMQQREAVLKQHKAVLSSVRADAQAAAEQQQQRRRLQQQLKDAQAQLVQLQAQLEKERSEHEALLASERQRHRRELADSMNSSVRKMTADKLRCREHLSLQMQFFKAEAESLSQALASPTPCVTNIGSSGPESPGDDSSGAASDSPTGLSDVHEELSPTRTGHASVRQSLLPDMPLQQLEVAGAIGLPGDPAAAALLQDASHSMQLAGGDNGSGAFSSRSSSTSGSIASASGASAAAAAGGSSSCISGSWPASYLPKEEVDMVAAAAAFSQLRGGSLSVEHLQRFLEHRMLGGKLHAKTLADGSKKRKHQLVQDMLAYHAWHLANSSSGVVSSSSRPGSSCRNSVGTASMCASVAAAAAAAAADPYGASSPVACSSISSSQDSSCIMHPLGLVDRAPSASSRPSRVPSCSQLGHMQYDQDPSPHVAVAMRCSSANGRSQPAARADWDSSSSQGHGRSVFSVEAADANSSHQQQVNKMLSPEQGAQQQQQQQGTPKSGPWSWLTPKSKGKQHSILGQLQPGDKAALRHNHVAASSWSPELSNGSGSIPAARRSSGEMTQPQQPQLKLQLSMQLPKRQLGGAGCDAVSPRDTRLDAAAAAMGAAADTAAQTGRLALGVAARGRGHASQPCSPSGGYGLLHAGLGSSNGSSNSAMIGSAVSEFYVDSPAVKLAAKGSRSNRQQGAGSDPLRLSVDLGSAHRSNWRQAQLMRPK